jgi:RNA polymerase sigma-70 factor, ECF subfamily
VSLASWDAARVMAAGDAGASSARLREVLSETEPFLMSLARRLCRNEHDARDLVQDTFEHALRASDAAPANPRGYLAVMLKNLFIDRCRSLAARPNVVPLERDHEVATTEPEAAPPWGRVSIADVKTALAEIEPDFRRVYEMHVFEQRTYEEIARELGIQRLTVGTRLTRTRQRLRVILCRIVGEDVPA